MVLVLVLVEATKFNVVRHWLLKVTRSSGSEMRGCSDERTKNAFENVRAVFQLMILQQKGTSVTLALERNSN